MLTKGQDIALKKCLEWLKKPTKQVFRIYGSAGSGKSFLIGEIVKQSGLDPEEIAFCAPTGKAATVLMQRYAYPNIGTLHHLIYIPYTKDKLILTKDNEIDCIESTSEFSKKDSLEDVKLIILDEVSMVDDIMMSDLLSFGIPVIAVGDPYQLPPIEGKPLDPNGADALLTEIVRQAADNPIIKIANEVRLGRRLKIGNYGDVKVISKDMLSKDMMTKLLLSTDQVICGLNATRRKLNKRMRDALGLHSILPVIGDKLICKSNEHGMMVTPEISLCNGMIGKCYKDAKNVGDDLITLGFIPEICNQKMLMLSDSSVFTNAEFKFDPHWKAYIMRNGMYVAKKKILDEIAIYDMKMWKQLRKDEASNKMKSVGETTISRFDYAYAISCHASQGSEFNSVVVVDEADVFRQNASRWLYTAVTRAKDKLIVIE